VFLRVEALSLYYDQINPVAPSSYTGATSAATIMQTLAGQMGLAFENNGVDTQLSNPYLPNTLVEQSKSVQKAANIDVYVEGSTMAITPKGVPRGGLAPLITPQTGLVGYPTIDKFGINFQCFFTPGIRFGGQVQVQSDVPKANGVWRVYSINHMLESERPGGKWHSRVACTEFDRAPVISNG